MVRQMAGLVIGAAALAASGSTPLQAQAFNGAQVIQAVGLADLQQFVLQHGDTVVTTGQQGTVSIVGKTKGGASYVMLGADCNQPGIVGCQAINMQIRFTITPAVTDATLSQANARFAAIKVWKDQGAKVVGIADYLVLRGGVTRQNVLQNLDVLLGLTPAAAQVAFGRAPAAPQSPAPQRPQGQ